MQKRAVLVLMTLSAALTTYLTFVESWPFAPSISHAAANGSSGQGTLQVISKDGKPSGVCPLTHTSVNAEISGFLSRVSVTQEFGNPFDEKIEAVYIFPLPQNAAVDDMTMTVGDRVVRGRIKPREEAREIYEAARAAGHVASLLDQERPNIFTQSVANIMPGEKVTVTISYVETLKYENGAYEFVFPMVVGPRYVPGELQAPGTGPVGTRGTDLVPDASRITPPVAPRGTRAGHDISIDVSLDAGVPIKEIESALHEVDIKRPNNRSAVVRLRDKNEIPNRDFIMKFAVAGERVEDALIAHRSDRGGFFTLILQPPQRVQVEDVTPKELVFVLDTSGSMSGFPLEKAKETMKLALEGLYPQDTFNLITFAGDTHVLFPEPVPATRENLARAQQFLSSRSGRGGTEMMKAIKAALDPSDAQGYIRIVCFMTDGYIGNDFEIISEIQKHPNARVFSFGIGSSVNRFLLDKMAEHSRGEVEYVTLSDDGSAAARRFHERVRNPLLTDISVDWSGLPVSDVYPRRTPDLFGAKPLVLSGRYSTAANGVVRLNGTAGGRRFSREIPVVFPDLEARNDVVATLWARRKIGDLMAQDYAGMQRGTVLDHLRDEITKLGLEFRLATQFTSFVAVEEMMVTDGGVPRRVEVPVDMPHGVSHEGVFGGEDHLARARTAPMGQLSLSPGVVPPHAPVRERVTNRDEREGGSQAGTIGALSGSRSEDKPTADDLRRRELLSKLHPAIAALIERVKSKRTTAGPGEERFVRNGKAEIRIWLDDKSPQAITKLEQLGFEVVLDPKTVKFVIGRVPVEKIEELAQLDMVRYIAPSS